MTKIYIKGILAKKFGSFFEGFVKDAYSAIRLIDANKNGFLKTLLNLNNENVFYAIICDGKLIETENQFLEKRKIQTINIVPIIVGSGAAVAIAIGLVTSAGTLTLAGTIVAGVVNAVIGAVVSLGISFLMNAINKQANPQIAQQRIAVGGGASTIESKGRSYIFSNNQNLTSQGSAIPVGYGRMKISSSIIHASVKSYPTNQTAQDEFKIYSSSSVFLDFLAQ